MSLRRWSVCFGTITLLATGCGTPHYAHLVERPLRSFDGDDLACPGYLTWSHEPVRDVFLVINGSGTGSNAFVHPSLARPMSLHPVAYLTYDKPGIEARFGDGPRVRHRDDGSLQKYTLGRGIACATNALRWARERFGPSVRLHLRGHSEGAWIALIVYDALLGGDEEMAGSIETLVLTGLPLEPFKDILDHQLSWLPDGNRLRGALSSCDWALLRERLGVSCAYVEDAARRPSGRELLERLAARGSAARFFIFHGTDDRNTPVAPVRALEAWNASRGHLRIEFHYYEGGHRGTDSARAEMARLLTALVTP
jgi:predicted esterase